MFPEFRSVMVKESREKVEASTNMLTLNRNTASRRRLVRTKEAAEYLGISPWKLRRLIQGGQLPVVQDSDDSPFLLDMRDLDSYIDRNKRLPSL